MIRIYIWRIPRRTVPWAIVQMALGRIDLGRDAKIDFWKLLGTGRGETFTPRDADISQWGLLLSTSHSLDSLESLPIISRWRKKALSEFSATLTPLSSHGQWSKREPFVVASPENSSSTWDGQVAAITRARIKWRKNPIFWRAVPPVTTSLHQSPGLLGAIGIGEAPIGLQGTFSLWKDGRSLRDFAYRGEAHKAAIEATQREGWYAEELFARFAASDVSGSISRSK